MASQTDEALSMQLSQFLTSENTRPEDRQALTVFLEASPKYLECTSYITDIEQRQELLRQIQQGCKDRDYELNSTAALWSILMVLPMDRLRSLHELYLNSPMLTAALNDVASKIPLLLKAFLAKKSSHDDLIRAQVSETLTRSSGQSRASSKASVLSRDTSEKDKCELRDKCCVVTGAAHPDICHVFPFSAKKNSNQISSCLSALTSLWGDEVFQRLRILLIGNENIIDSAANMIALQPLLHRWWGHAIFGLEPIEKIEKGIRLRVRWLSKTNLVMSNQVSLDLNPIECFVSYSVQGHIGIAHSKTHRPISDGTVFEITAQDESAIPSWDLFSLQWDLVRMASLCGAAEASDDDDWESDDDEASAAKAATTIDDWYLDSPVTASATPMIQPLQSLPTQSQDSSPTRALQSRESSPIKSSQRQESPPTEVLQSRESSPTKVLQSRQSSPTKSPQRQESSPTKALQSRESSPTKSSQRQESSSAKSHVDENNPW